MLSPLQSLQTGEEQCQFITFSDPFPSDRNESVSQAVDFDHEDGNGTAKELLKLLSSQSLALKKTEIERLLSGICASALHEDFELALAELCLEINVLSGISGGIGKRITVWFDSYSQRLNLRKADGQTDCISLAALLTNRV